MYFVWARERSVICSGGPPGGEAPENDRASDSRSTVWPSYSDECHFFDGHDHKTKKLGERPPAAGSLTYIFPCGKAGSNGPVPFPRTLGTPDLSDPVESRRLNGTFRKRQVEAGSRLTGPFRQRGRNPEGRFRQRGPKPARVVSPTWTETKPPAARGFANVDRNLRGWFRQRGPKPLGGSTPFRQRETNRRHAAVGDYASVFRIPEGRLAKVNGKHGGR